MFPFTLIYKKDPSQVASNYEETFYGPRIEAYQEF